MNERSFIPPPHYVLVPLLEGQLIDTPSASLVTLMRDSCWADTPWRVPTCCGRCTQRPYWHADNWRTRHAVSLLVSDAARNVPTALRMIGGRTMARPYLFRTLHATSLLPCG